VDLNFVAIGMALADQLDGLILGASRHSVVWKTYLDHLFAIRNLPIGYKLIFNEEKKFIVADTAFYKHPTPEELMGIAKSAAKVARVFGWEPRVAMCSYATLGHPRNSNSHTVEKAVELMNADKSINFE